MADAVAPAGPEAAGADGAQPAQGPGLWGIISGILKQAMFFYFITTAMKGFFSPSSQPGNANVTVQQASSVKAMNLFPTHQLFDLYVYLDENVSGVQENN